MRGISCKGFFILLLYFAGLGELGAVDRYVSAAGANVAPFVDWSSAATNIQDAINIATNGDVVWVTNGIYQTGAIISPGGFLSNRVALTKSLIVQSINGPAETIIQGFATPGSTNGPASIRCAWVGTNATLSGFTLTGGTTLATSSDFNGGGVFCQSSNAIITNCVIVGNVSAGNGAGVYQGSLFNCSISNNSTAGNGGGAYLANLDHCFLTGNSAAGGGGAYKGYVNACEMSGNIARNGGMTPGNSGGGARLCTLRNCKILNNYGNGVESSFVQGCFIQSNRPYGAMFSTNVNCTIVGNNTAVLEGFSTNCILWFNVTPSTESGRKVRCLIQPDEFSNMDAGSLRIFPNLLSDGLHLGADSPAIGQGINDPLNPVDIDGQTWSTPLSIGCDEWQPQLLLVSQPNILPGTATDEAVIQAEFTGLSPYCWWTKDGVSIENDSRYASAHTTRLTIRDFNIVDRGDYQVVASNNFGMVTSAVVTISITCVDLANSHPASPYTNWSNASVTIQDAVDAAPAGGVVLVTNGVYATGGRFVNGDMTNRVVLDKPVTVLSMNGPQETVIEGAWDPVSTNGPLSVRCAWIGERAVLGGFTLRNGSTPTNGGGIWSSGLGLMETTAGCIITNCQATGSGGGAYRGRLRDCVITGNTAAGNGGGTALAILDGCLIQNNSSVKNVSSRGGGVYGGVARRCQILGNSSSGSGGGASGLSQSALLLGCSVAFNTAAYFSGAFDSLLYQCTVVSNTATAGPTAGVSFCDVWNSILYFNTGVPDAISGTRLSNAGGSGTYHSVCTFPLLFTGSITNDPQMLDALHIAVTSPCRGAGTNFGIAGFADIDADPWLATAPIGCDEVVESELIGPLGITLSGWPEVAVGGVFPVGASINGRASQLKMDFGDGTVTSNSVFGITHIWPNPGNYMLTGQAFNNDNPQGVNATLSVHVVPVVNPVIASTGISASIFSLQFLCQPGLTYELDATTNLAPPVSWQALESLSSTGGVVTAIDTNRAPAQKFYRLKVQ